MTPWVAPNFLAISSFSGSDGSLLRKFDAASQGELMGRIRESGKLSDDDEAELKKALDTFKNMFQPSSAD